MVSDFTKSIQCFKKAHEKVSNKIIFSETIFIPSTKWNQKLECEYESILAFNFP